MGRLSDKAMVDLGRQYVTIRGQLLAELKARKITSVEKDGVKVAMRTNTIKTWNVAGLAKQLTRTVKAKVIVQRVDARAFAKAVKAGEITTAVAATAVLAETPSAPFLEVTVKDS